MNKNLNIDYVVLGAGIYGLYTSYLLLKKGFSVAVVEADDKLFSRASYVNQARVHQGYHYPRSVSTGRASAECFQRFSQDFENAINARFKKIYAISACGSYTSSQQYMKFCEACNISAVEVNPELYFSRGMIEGAFETEEYSFDARILSGMLLERINKFNDFYLFKNTIVFEIDRSNDSYLLNLSNGISIKTNGVFSCVYASINQVLSQFGFEAFNIKYEIAEITLCNVDEILKGIGLTVMDGPFFSIMPFGKTGMHSLTSVEFTPHKTCMENLPTFDCQKLSKTCSPLYLDNCNTCNAKPKTSFEYMRQLARKYMKKNYTMEYKDSLFAIKPILQASEVDDSRPTVIRKLSESPLFVTVLSGKIDTIYEMDKIIKEL